MVVLSNLKGASELSLDGTAVREALRQDQQA